MSTYAVVGGTLWGNRGAEAMVVTAIGQIRRRDHEARFLILSYQAERDRELLRSDLDEIIDASPRRLVTVHLPWALILGLLATVRLRVPDAMLPKEMRRIRRCSALFDVSGISFHDDRLGVSAYNLACLLPAILLKIPVIRLSQAMGPFNRMPNRIAARYVAQRSLHSFARGHATAAYMRQLGVPDAQWSIAPDVAFAYSPEFSLTDENQDRTDALTMHLSQVRAEEREIVALVPSSLVLKSMERRGLDYIGILETLIRRLSRQDYHVLVLPNATSAEEATLRNNDIVPIRRLRERTNVTDASTPSGGKSLSFVDYNLNTAAIRSLLEPCGLVITSRFHAMVAALALGIPTLVMGWSHKYQEVLEMFSCAEDAIDFRDGEAKLDVAVSRVLDELDDRRQRIRRALPDVTRAAEKQFDIVAQLPHDEQIDDASRRRGDMRE